LSHSPKAPPGVNGSRGYNGSLHYKTTTWVNGFKPDKLTIKEFKRISDKGQNIFKFCSHGPIVEKYYPSNCAG